MRKPGTIYLLISMALWTAATVSCTGRFMAFQARPAVIRNEHVAVVTVAEKDTLESLARTYLGNAGEAWQIAQYNQVRSAEAGQRLVIPLQPVAPGGVRLDGYQVVPILYYPRLNREKGAAARIFEGQVQFLRENGYETISLERLSAFLNLSGPLPPKAIMITFDSAETWIFEIAYPILKRNGFTAALFIPTAQVGKPRRLGWKELAAMAADGFDIGTSGVRAQSLRNAAKKKPEDYLRGVEEEIVLSKKDIDQKLNIASTYFSYPGGQHNDLLICLLKKHGYSGAFTREPGENSFFVDNFKLRRTIVSGQETEERFRQYLTTFHPADLR